MPPARPSCQGTLARRSGLSSLAPQRLTASDPPSCHRAALGEVAPGVGRGSRAGPRSALGARASRPRRFAATDYGLRTTDSPAASLLRTMDHGLRTPTRATDYGPLGANSLHCDPP